MESLDRHRWLVGLYLGGNIRKHSVEQRTSALLHMGDLCPAGYMHLENQRALSSNLPRLPARVGVTRSIAVVREKSKVCHPVVQYPIRIEVETSNEPNRRSDRS